jgi:hypothetical protein
MLGPSVEQANTAKILCALDRAFRQLKGTSTWLYPRSGHVLHLPLRPHLPPTQPDYYLVHCTATGIYEGGTADQIPLQIHVCAWRLHRPSSFMVAMLRDAIYNQAVVYPAQSTYAVWHQHENCSVRTHTLKNAVFLGDSVKRGDILGPHYIPMPTDWQGVWPEPTVVPSISAMAKATPPPPNQGQELTAEYLQRHAASLDALKILKQGERFA